MCYLEDGRHHWAFVDEAPDRVFWRCKRERALNSHQRVALCFLRPLRQRTIRISTALPIQALASAPAVTTRIFACGSMVRAVLLCAVFCASHRKPHTIEK
jgi:hypothetical protein